MDENFLSLENRAKALIADVSASVIGSRVRRERLAQNISIRDLATKANVSPNSITRLEAGSVFRAITLMKVCEALQIHLDRIASAVEGDVATIHRNSDDEWHQLDGYSLGYFGGQSKNPDQETRRVMSNELGQNPLKILRSRLEGGVLLSSIIEVHVPSEPRSHPGEELAYVLLGPVQVNISGKAHILETNESIVFWGTEPHSYEPVDGKMGLVLSVRATG